MYAPRRRRGGGLSLLYISISYCMHKGGSSTRKHVFNGRPRGGGGGGGGAGVI